MFAEPVTVVTELQQSKASRGGSGVLARRLGGSFARVVVVATVVCGLLLFFLTQVGAYVRQMQRDESAIHRGLDLAIAIREQYIHAAHTMIVGEPSHLAHYAEWVRKVQDGTSELRSQVPPEQQWRIDRIREASEGADRLFLDEIVPAALAQDTARVRVLNQTLDEEAASAASDADFVALAVEARMSEAHMDTTRVTYVAGSVAVFGIILLVGLATVSTRRLRKAVLRPLAALAEAARRIGQGDFQARVAMMADGEPAEGELGLVATAFDRMAEQLLEHQRRLVNNERMAAIGQLAAGVAHEINNPIGVIRGYLRTMIPEAQREELRKELEILDEEAAACQRIADDLVAYARSPELNKTEVEMAELLRQIGERFETSGESKGCHVQVEADSSNVRVDGVRMRQVVQNLLRNAVQASGKGALVEVRGEVAAESYVIRVLDRGSGISPELGPRIFEPFMSGRANGTGLGLAVCDGITRAHQGTIEARARHDGGTEFVVTFPRTEVPSRLS
ncbi:MAG: ATP-binding protein [Deltaproteobacteria bacterium]